MARSEKQQRKYEEDRARVKKLSEEGLSPRVISQRTGISEGWVVKLRRELGYGRKK